MSHICTSTDVDVQRRLHGHAALPCAIPGALRIVCKEGRRSEGRALGAAPGRGVGYLQAPDEGFDQGRVEGASVGRPT
jgi:hypothetical protein